MATAFQSDESCANRIKDLVACFICKEQTISQLVQLNCFHICHTRCLKKSLGNAKPGSKFNCSECKTANLVPTGGVEGYPDELLQYKLKEIASIFSNPAPPCHICEQLGEENTSTNYCITCKMHLCSNDTKRHAVLPDHKIITNDEIQTQQYLPKILTTKKALCPVHSTDDSAKVLEFFCQQCQIPVCQVCWFIEHKPHKIITIQEAGRKFKEKLKNKATEIQNKESQYESARKKLEKLLNEIETNSKQQVEKCQKWGEDVKQMVDKIVHKNVQNIEDNKRTQTLKIFSINAENNDRGKQIYFVRKYMEAFLKFGSDSDFMQKYETYFENLQTCLKQNTKVIVPIEEPLVECGDTQEIETDLEEMMKVETIYEIRQLISPPPPPTLKSCHLELKWEVGSGWTGIAVDGEDVLAVREKKIEIYSTNGKHRGEIECEGLENAWDIAIVGKQLFASDTRCREIMVINRKGFIERKISLPAQEQGKNGALSLAVDHTRGDLYVSSFETNVVYKCLKGQTQAYPFIIRGLDRPAYLCVTNLCEIIVCCNGNTHTVCKYKSDGTLAWRYGGFWGERQFNEPHGVCMDPWGHVFVCDSSNDRIHQLSPSGKLLSFINIGEKIEKPKLIVYHKEKLIITSSPSKVSKILVIKCQYS